jgi:hypothetical protein
VEELKTLRKKVASGTLEPPKYWAPTKDATVAERHVLYEGDVERSALLQSFLTTLGGNKSTVQIVCVERIQNKAMFQSYVVKRQTMCYRETGDNDDATVQQQALQRFERRWLWHGTNAEVVDKIMNQVRATWERQHTNVMLTTLFALAIRLIPVIFGKQGVRDEAHIFLDSFLTPAALTSLASDNLSSNVCSFNRNFAGRNATAYGFARDASYSANRMYSVPDAFGLQRILACSVCESLPTHVAGGMYL